MCINCYDPMLLAINDVELLVNYIYLERDILVDNLFSVRQSRENTMIIDNWVVPSDNLVTINTGKGVIHNVRYYVRFIDYCRQFSANPHGAMYICHTVYVTLVVFYVVANIHLKYLISMDVSGKQYTNCVGYLVFTVTEIECTQFLISIFDHESDLSDLKDTFTDLYDDLCTIGDSSCCYKFQEFHSFTGKIYCPLRLVSIFKYFIQHRELVCNIFSLRCSNLCGNILCSFTSYIVCNRELLNAMDQI